MDTFPAVESQKYDRYRRIVRQVEYITVLYSLCQCLFQLYGTQKP